MAAAVFYYQKVTLKPVILKDHPYLQREPKEYRKQTFQVTYHQIPLGILQIVFVDKFPCEVHVAFKTMKTGEDSPVELPLLNAAFYSDSKQNLSLIKFLLAAESGNHSEVELRLEGKHIDLTTRGGGAASIKKRKDLDFIPEVPFVDPLNPFKTLIHKGDEFTFPKNLVLRLGPQAIVLALKTDPLARQPDLQEDRVVTYYYKNWFITFKMNRDGVLQRFNLAGLSLSAIDETYDWIPETVNLEEFIKKQDIMGTVLPQVSTVMKWVNDDHI